MAGLGDLTAQSLGSSKAFNWTWFIELITCGILVVWFFFYFNRLLATILSWTIRTYTWHTFRVYVDIQALQISLLGGRIFFKGVRYHGQNESIYVHSGHLTWRYWLQSTRRIDLTKEDVVIEEESATHTPASEKTLEESDFESGKKTTHHTRKGGSSEARLLVSVTGLEWFIYNRTPVYDAIIKKAEDGALPESKSPQASRATAAVTKAVEKKLRRKSTLRKSSTDEKDSDGEEETIAQSTLDRPSLAKEEARLSADTRSSASTRQDVGLDSSEVSASYSFILKFMPLAIECARGAISLGNEHTKALIVTTFEKARGHVDAGGSGPADIFKQIFEFDVDHPLVQMRPNPDYNLPQSAAAERIISGSGAVLQRRPWWKINFHLYRRKRKMIHSLRNLIPGYHKSVENLHKSAEHVDLDETYAHYSAAQPDSANWHGLDRYMDEDDADDHHTWMNIEYARFSTLFDCPKIHLEFYWDSPGTVKAEHLISAETGLAKDINGIEPPAYGLYLAVYGGTVNYGPWTDRMRAELQSIFLPASYKCAVPSLRLLVGQMRQSSTMNIRIDINDEITLRIPVRESSKDWRWRGRATAVRDAAALRRQQERKHFRFRRGNKRRVGPDVRPFGWFSISVGHGSTVSYVMDMYPGYDGYRNDLQLRLKNTKATSSVNHALLWQCREHNVSCNLSNPLGWNEMHRWRFDLENRDMDLYLLRDHTFLLIDLISDFTAGQKSDYMTFVPFQYDIGVGFQNFKLFLNANDYNIIDNPTEMDENAFLTLGFEKLDGEVSTPMRLYSPTQSAVHFKGDGSNAYLTLKLPSWSTLNAFAKDDTMATLKSMSLNGVYNYYSTNGPQLTDSLFMDIKGGNPKFYLQGFLIRYFMNVKENYFGDHIHFSTLEEYQAKISSGNLPNSQSKRPPAKKQNDLDVILSVRADESCVLMPANVYERSNNVRVDVLAVEADMRFTNYYMDLQVNTSPVEVSKENETEKDGKKVQDSTSCQMFVDGVTVYGHRLFGAPPTEPTYVCNWDFDIGYVTGECSSDFLQTTLLAVLAFVFTMDDDENALPQDEILIPDVTFLRARSAGVTLWLVSSETAFLLETAATTVALNDWAKMQFSKELEVDLPALTIAAVDARSAYRQRESMDQKVETLAYATTALKLSLLSRKSEFALNRAKQQQHVYFHDQRTHRTNWLLHPPLRLPASEHKYEWSRTPPAMPFPEMPEPLKGSKSGQPPRTASSFRDAKLWHTNGVSKDAAAHGIHKHSLGPRAEARSNIHRSINTSRSRGSNPNSAADIVISSPWTPPQFPLLKVRPDHSHLPDGIDVGTSFKPTSTIATDLGDSATDQDSPKHDGIFCDFGQGIRVFCTASLFSSVAKLIDELSPSSPSDLLDKIHMSTISNIKTLTIAKADQLDDIAVHLPYARMRILNYEKSATSLTPTFDQFDIGLKKVSLTMRVAPRPLNSGVSQLGVHNILIYMTLNSLDIHISEHRPSQQSSRISANMHISDTNLWLSLQDTIRAGAQVNIFSFDVHGRNVSSMADLIYRTETMIEVIALEMQSLDQRAAIEHVVYHLIRDVEKSEPVLLSRPSYVLRTATEHVRLNESWKSISRLRDKWIRMQDRKDPCILCKHNCLKHEELSHVQKHIQSAFNQWHSWEGSGNADEPITKAIFGDSAPGRDQFLKDPDVEIEIVLGHAALNLDPGPHQSQFSIRNLDLNVSDKPVHETQDGWNIPTMSSQRRTTLQAYSGDMTVVLNWELLELADSLIHKLNANAFEDRTSQKSHQVFKSTTTRDIIVLAGLDSAALQIDTMNVRLLSGLEKFRLSFVKPFAEGEKDKDMAITLASSSALLRLYSHQKALFGWRLTFPSIYVSSALIVDVTPQHQAFRLAATCKKLRFRMVQDILELLDVTKIVLRDEVPVIEQLLASLDHEKKDTTAKASSSEFEIPPAHLVLLLNNYKLDFALMPYLRYSIAGKVARTSFTPHSAAQCTLDMDLKDSHHYFENTNIARDRKLPSLDIPPLNARVSISLSPQHIQIHTLAAMEVVKLRASAIKACFDAAYQQRTSEYIKDVRRSTEKIENDLKHLKAFSDSTEDVPKMTVNKREIEYSGHVVLAGLELLCSAPVVRSEVQYRAELRFGLGQTSLRIHNQRGGSQKTFKLPQLELKVPEITIAVGSDLPGHKYAGNLTIGTYMKAETMFEDHGVEIHTYQVSSNGIELNINEDTMMLAADLSNFLQDRIKTLMEKDNGKKLQTLRRMTISSGDKGTTEHDLQIEQPSLPVKTMMDAVYAVDIRAVRVKWNVKDQHSYSAHKSNHDLVFSIERIDLKTRREGSGRLTIRGMQLQLAPKTNKDPVQRSASSALLPEMVFNAAYISTKDDRRLAFKAAGKAVDVRLASDFIIPAAIIQRSLARASTELQAMQKSAPKETAEPSRAQLPQFLGNKRLASLLVYADFAGTVVTVTPKKEENTSAFGFLKGPKRSKAGRYGQAVQSGDSDAATLRAPGIAFKIEYRDNGKEDPTLSTEIKVAASSNTLAPSVVPLIQEISSSITNVIGQDNNDSTKDAKPNTSSPSKGLTSDGMIEASDPTAILGRVKLNAGLRIERQEFSLTCQPIARVSATARFDEIFVTINTVQPQDQDRFFSVMTTFSNLSASVQHVYSRESTASFEVESIVMSLMNSKHFSNKSGVSAILTVSPMKADMNAKQLQDFLLFREIWYPEELRHTSKPQVVTHEDTTAQGNAIQRFQEISATAAVPWHAIVSISELQFQIDLGQSLGKSNFIISKLWASSKKTSESEQNLCIGFEKVGIDSTGRMSGFVELQDFRVRTAIKWPRVDNTIQAPLVQGSIGFEHLRAKLAFDYQPFGVADISAFELLMYNVRDRDSKASDRLVAILDGGKVQAFLTTSAAAQGLAIYQAFERLIQEKQEAYRSSLHELDRFLRRRSVFPSSQWGPTIDADEESKHEVAASTQTASLNTDVVISIKAIDIGAFPATFFDQQMLKVEAVDVQARFAVGQEPVNKIHSGLGMSLGQVGVALSSVSRPNAKALGEVSVTEIIERATTSRGGTILRVPRLIASMQTWQQADSNVIEYIFSSVFRGKVDVGWNYSRISFIRTMWETHSRALTHRMGKPLAPSAVKITAEPQGDGIDGAGQEKITAVVNMPQSKYEYIPLEPPIIDTPQLRDLGEATPSLEWIGLHREKLPNVTHSVIIVTLLELAREVEDSYHRILGSS